MDVKVCLGIQLCVIRRVPRGSRGLILGSTGRGAPHSWEHWKGAPLFVSRQCFPNNIDLEKNMMKHIESSSSALVTRQLTENPDDCIEA